MSPVEPLKLIALDRDDLEVVSAHLQDSTLKAAEILWRPNERRVVIALDRFDWEAAHGTSTWQRRRSALRFERVTSCKCKSLDKGTDQELNLLTVDFAEQDSPSGVVTLLFAGGGALRLEVECLEAELADLGPVWAANCCPEHDDIKGSTQTA